MAGALSIIRTTQHSPDRRVECKDSKRSCLSEILALAASLLLFGCVAHKSLAVVRTLGRNSKAREEALTRVLRFRVQQAGLRLLLLLLLLLPLLVAVVGTGTGE